MYWQASIAIVSVAAWLQIGQVMMDCLSIPALPSVGLATVSAITARAGFLRHFFRP
jgi:hypothetical protein